MSEVTIIALTVYVIRGKKVQQPDTFVWSEVTSDNNCRNSSMESGLRSDNNVAVVCDQR